MSGEIKGLSISLSDPFWYGAEAAPIFPNITDNINSYSHTIDVAGGYKQCRLQLAGNQEDAETWYMKIGGHVEVFNEAAEKIWEGFVNKISLSLGTLSATRGPMMDLDNKVSAIYTEETFSYEGGISFGGDRVVTAAAEDSGSQTLYGVHETLLSLGNGDPTALDLIPQTHLSDNKNPPVTNTITIGSEGSGVSISIECLGYSSFFDEYYYEQIASAGTATASDKLKAIITADPNSIFSTEFSGITTNATLTDSYAAGEESAMSLIKGIVSLGDASNNRYIWGVYNDRKFSYGSIPTTVKYEHKISDPSQAIVDESSAVIFPWNIMPGEFMLVSDFLVGHVAEGTNLRDDPRIMFIESVTYTAPWGVAMQGGKFDKVSQQINRLGLGGM